ncbi:hypothetical protein RJT34_19355 [Clitoria ternatea]|uniref:Uncharacterized protein n=1 Tax=Clitoria ternatea TaxID=43366 RepID=A0AAN9IR41_CLITE
MTNSLSLLSSLFILLLSCTTVPAITKVANKDNVPCTMCAECENPCQPLPPPPPPVIECPPPPPPSPPPPSPPPPSPRLPPAVVECPPPPQLPCQNNCEMPPHPPYPPQSYFPPPGTPYGYVPDYYNARNGGGKILPFQMLLFSNLSSNSGYFILRSLIHVAFLSLPSVLIYLFD